MSNHRASICFALLLQLLAVTHRAEADARDDWRALYSQWEVHFDAGRYREAEPIARQMVTLAERSLTHVPTLIANSYNNLGITCRGLARYADAEQAHLKTLKLREQILGPQHLDVSRTLNNLGYVYHNQGRYAQAEQVYQRAIEIKQRQLGPNHLELSDTIHNLGLVYADWERFAEAEKLDQRALSIVESQRGSNHPDVADSLTSLSTIRQRAGHIAEAEALARRALAIYESAYGTNHLRVSNLQSHLASLVRPQGRYAEAEERQRKALAVREKLLGKDHPTVADTMAYLSQIQVERGQYAAAEDGFRTAIKMLEDKLGAEHPNLVGALSNYSVFLRERRRFEESEQLLTRAIAIQDKTLGRDHPATAFYWNNYGILYREQGRYADAERCHAKALELLHKMSLPRPSQIADTQHNIATAWLMQGRKAEAEKLEREVLAAREKAFGPVHPDVAQSLHNLAQNQMAQQHFREAEVLQQREISILEQSTGPQNALLVPSLVAQAHTFSQQGCYSDAELALERAAVILQSARGPEHVDVATVLNLRANALEAQQRFADSEKLHQRALAIRRQALGADHPSVAMSLNNLAIVNQRLGRLQQAEQLISEALAVFEKTYGKGSDYASCLNNLAMVQRDRGELDNAFETYSQALEIHRQNGEESPSIATTLQNLAATCFALGKLDEAQEYANQAISISDRIGVSPGDRFENYDLRAQVRKQLGNHDDAFADLRQAIVLAEEQRALGSGGEQERAVHFAQFAKAYDRLLDWNIERGNIAEAFELAERSRARSLLDQVELRSTDLLSGIPATEAQALRTRLDQSREALALVQQQLAGISSAENRQSLLDSLQQAQSRVADAYRQIRTASPKYRTVIGRNFEPVSLTDLQTWANAQQALVLEYHSTPAETFLFGIIPDSQPQVTRLAISAEQSVQLQLPAGAVSQAVLNDLLNMGELSLQARLSSAEAADSPEVRSTLAKLWQVLIPEPLRTRINDGQWQRLIVIPHGAISTIPFEVLIVDAGMPPVYLLDVAPPICYGPSSTALLSLNELSRNAADSASVLTIGDPDYTRTATSRETESPSATRQLAVRTRYSSLGGRLTRLPFSGVESRWVADVFRKNGVTVAQLQGKEATEAAVRNDVTNRSVVHIACHGLADSTYGNLFGSLALTPGSGSPPDDGSLSLAELYELNLQGCQLTILSACESNFGPQQRTEGSWTLSRGCLVAGSQRVVASNWLVDDEAAASLISYFCGGVARDWKDSKPGNYAQRLQDAKRWVRQQEKWQSPYYWAPFVLVGSN